LVRLSDWPSSGWKGGHSSWLHHLVFEPFQSLLYTADAQSLQKDHADKLFLFQMGDLSLSNRAIADEMSGIIITRSADGHEGKFSTMILSLSPF
jgi:hypothetical protein